MTEFIRKYARVFTIPAIVLLGIILYFLLNLWPEAKDIRDPMILAVIGIGSVQLVVDSVKSILEKSLALDYIAITAITLGVLTHEYIAGAIIVLMMAGGNALEKYANDKAKSSLQKLKDRIPNFVTLQLKNDTKVVDIATVKVGDILLVRKGEVVGLDGKLDSGRASIDESSLTGEAIPVEKLHQDVVRSGTVNIGDPILVQVTKVQAESTYKRITDLVTQAQSQKTRFIRLADKYSLWFTLITFTIATFTYLFTQDFNRVLAVLVIATPCPLILATPVALIGGVNSAASRSIVIKNLGALELISACKLIVFDKTGTLTMGTPKLTQINSKSGMKESDILVIAEALERNSLHPFAKSIVQEAAARHLVRQAAENVTEELGKGISGEVEGKVYQVVKSPDPAQVAIQLKQGKQVLGELIFEDVLKQNVRDYLHRFKSLGYRIVVLSGDKRDKVKGLARELSGAVDKSFAEVTPQGKLDYIKMTQSNGTKLMMVGDGINDAPALAAADAGVVYSHEEYTASAAAGDVILLKNDISSVLELTQISQRTIHIALQSIYIGLGLSIVGMCFASFGFIVPVVGAILQELIDVGVIFNSLRASRA